MVPNLTGNYVVVLNTACNSGISTVGEIGVIKGLEDFLANSKGRRNVFEVGADTLHWKDPEWLEEVVTNQLFDESGNPKVTGTEEQYWNMVNDPIDTLIDYQMEIEESLDGIVMCNRSVLQDLADNYIIESWEVTRQLPGLMVLTVKGAKCGLSTEGHRSGIAVKA